MILNSHTRTRLEDLVDEIQEVIGFASNLGDYDALPSLMSARQALLSVVQMDERDRRAKQLREEQGEA
jgi:hypothetical protein